MRKRPMHLVRSPTASRSLTPESRLFGHARRNVEADGLCAAARVDKCRHRQSACAGGDLVARSAERQRDGEAEERQREQRDGEGEMGDPVHSGRSDGEPSATASGRPSSDGKSWDMAGSVEVLAAAPGAQIRWHCAGGARRARKSCS